MSKLVFKSQKLLLLISIAYQCEDVQKFLKHLCKQNFDIHCKQLNLHIPHHVWS